VTNHRNHLVALVVVLSLLFNLERLDVAGRNTINLSPFAYVLATLIALVALRSSWWSRLPAIVSVGCWTGIYLAGHAFMSRPLLGGVHTYITVTELALLTAVALLTVRLGRGVTAFEDAVSTLTLARTDKTVMSIGAASAEVNRALLLSRRNERPLSVLVVEPIASSSTLQRAVDDMQRSLLDRFIVNSAANVLSDAIRRTDIAIHKAEAGRLVVVCPETDEATANVVVDHIQSALTSKLGMKARFGLASFPTEAFTFESLVERAERRVVDADRSRAGEMETATTRHEKTHSIQERAS